MNWPDGWKENALRAAKIPISDFAVNVLHHWEQSTPTDRWTNNPLGMPTAKYATPRALNSPYAAFPTLQAFYKAFGTAAHEGHGKPLYTVLGTSEKHAEAWRVIHALNWPANLTETDHPSALLDLIDEKVRKALKVKPASERKTVGVTPQPSGQHAAIRAQSQALHHAANNFSSGPLAIAYIVRSMGHHGR